LSDKQIFEIADDAHWKQYVDLTATNGVTEDWRGMAASIWKGFAETDNANFLDLLTESQFKRFDDLADAFDKDPQYFGAFWFARWDAMFSKYRDGFTKLMTEVVMKVRSTCPGHAAMKLSLQRKLDWIFFSHQPSTSPLPPFPVVTPKILLHLGTMFARIPRSSEEVRSFP